mmetsp:Transcript_10714/g.25302  ORF Transcript_10714/g.25302 Transcript_10714/m.25302 type:complete len:373 (+) Transcript_10714:621-1739(+)
MADHDRGPARWKPPPLALNLCCGLIEHLACARAHGCSAPASLQPVLFERDQTVALGAPSPHGICSTAPAVSKLSHAAEPGSPGGTWGRPGPPKRHPILWACGLPLDRNDLSLWQMQVSFFRAPASTCVLVFCEREGLMVLASDEDRAPETGARPHAPPSCFACGGSALLVGERGLGRKPGVGAADGGLRPACGISVPCQWLRRTSWTQPSEAATEVSTPRSPATRLGVCELRNSPGEQGCTLIQNGGGGPTPAHLPEARGPPGKQTPGSAEHRRVPASQAGHSAWHLSKIPRRKAVAVSPDPGSFRPASALDCHLCPRATAGQQVCRGQRVQHRALPRLPAALSPLVLQGIVEALPALAGPRWGCKAWKGKG